MNKNISEQVIYITFKNLPKIESLGGGGTKNFARKGG